MEEKFSIDDYCSLDDSSNIIKHGGFNLHLYGHGLYVHEDEEVSFLFLLKPKRVKLSYKVLQRFIIENKGDKKLVACKHYLEYPKLKDLIYVYCDRKIIRNKVIRAELGDLFQCADLIVSTRMRSVYHMLSTIDGMEEAFERIKNKEKKIMLASTEVLLYGFDKFRQKL